MVAAASSAAAEHSTASDADVRRAVERSLPFLEKAGVAWMHEKGCISCHTVSFMLWSHNVARSRGIAADEAKLAEWTQWTAKQSLTHRDENPTISGGKNDGGGLDTMAQLLVGRDASECATNGGEEWKKFMSSTPTLIVQMQESDGDWKAGGQLSRQLRSAAEADAVTTRWAIVALASMKSPDHAMKQAIAKALAATKDAPVGKSIDDMITRLLLAQRLGNADEATNSRKRLIESQHADGGWSWLVDGASDAFATGEALYALSSVGAGANEETIDKARRFLIESQKEDGTWPVTGAGISNAPTPQRQQKVEPIYRYWGTAWAAIGLGASLPERERVPVDFNRR